MSRVTRSRSTTAKKAAGIGIEAPGVKSEKNDGASGSRGQQPEIIEDRITTLNDLLNGSKKGKNSFVLSFNWLHAEKKSDKELDMVSLSGFIREQPDWVNQIKDKNQLTKLVEEFGTFKDASSSKEIVESVVKKLKDYLATKGNETIIDLGACDGTWQSDLLINFALKDQLLENIVILEDSIPEKQMDWNDENEQVWNLVSPSMYPLVSMRSKVLRYLPQVHADEIREGLIEYQSSEKFLSADEQFLVGFRNSGGAFAHNLSYHFQWLPSEFEIGEDNSVRIASYINNLHPDVHSSLYSVIEDIFGQFIPLFENVLNDLHNEIIKKKRSKGAAVPEEIQEFRMAGRTLQVITKFTNILLTPEKPSFPGGNFHIEGMGNEKIVATGIYYYSCENITEPRLEFQERVPGWNIYERKTRTRLPLDQKVGSILTKEGRCIAFPNNLQHRITSFELKDATQSGHRKILAFFLVDPSKKVISTRHVPPQQKSWFVQEIMKGPICFPQEVVEMIVKKLDWPMDFEEAREHRDEIRKERKPAADKRDINGKYYTQKNSKMVTLD